VGRRGWGGTPPLDDDEAVARIVEATVRLVQSNGAPATTMSAIADELGITRRTLYRYFDGVDDLFRVVGDRAFATYQERLEAETAHLIDPAALAVESVARIIETLATEPLLTLLLAVGHTETFTRAMLSAEIVTRCREILLSRRVDWSTVAPDADALDELVEFLLRLIQSMVIAPSEPARSPAELRAVLGRWIGPVLGG
jgi:AcrR family transcriptional regulator